MTSAGDDNSAYDYTYDAPGRMTYLEIDNGGPLVNFTQAFNLVGSRTVLATDIQL